MNKTDIENIIRQFPYLTIFGFYEFSEDLSPEKKAEFMALQEKLLSSAENCTKICEWLRQIRKTRYINGEFHSYVLKHVAEYVLGKCFNGEFICAAIYMGFNIRREGGDAY